MKKHGQEKLMKMFSFRHRYSNWRIFLTKPRNYSPFLLLLLFSIPLILLLVSFNYEKYRDSSTQKALEVLSRNYGNALEFPLDCVAWNRTPTCPRKYPAAQAPPSSPETACPEYFRWIYEDLRHWRKTGVTKEMVEKARRTAHFRLTILDGRIYVEKFRESIQTRALFTMWGIMQLVRWYPGRLPDLELMFDCDDRPVVAAKDFRKSGAEPPPVFRYCSDSKSLDIVFPDWSFWGWAEINLRPWRSVLKDIQEGNERTTWEERVPYAYWKGNPQVCPWRGDLMKCNTTAEYDWKTHLYVQDLAECMQKREFLEKFDPPVEFHQADWVAESQKGYKESNVGDQCTHRYKIYIEGWAWSVSEKYILACNSPTLVMTLQWHDFFIRGMVPQRHYWPVRNSNKCRSLKFAVEWGNNHAQKAKAIGEAGSRFIHEDLDMEHVYDYMLHLLTKYARLLKYKPSIPANAVELCPESMACSTEGNWRRFMEESLEKRPTDRAPCKMAQPYKAEELKAFVDGKVKATKQVEIWENEYWEKYNKKQ